MFLGDSGGRPVLWPASKLMGKTGFRDKILSGTDPLPLKGEEKRVGSYGGYIAGSCPETVSAMDLRDVLLESGKTILPFGKSLDPFLFVKNQLGLRLRR